MNRVALSSLALICCAASLSAQVCIGTAAFSAGPARIGAGLSSTKGAKAYNALLALGKVEGPFAGLTLSSYDFDDVDEGATEFSAHVGYSIPVGASKKVEFCPVAMVEHLAGPKFDTGFGTAEVSGNGFGVGGTFGGAASTSPNFDFVPFAGLMYLHASSSFEFQGTKETQSDDFGKLDLGAGFVLNRVVTVQPSVAIPFGLDGADPVYSLSITINIGKSSRSSSRVK